MNERLDSIRANHIYYDSSAQSDIAWLLALLDSQHDGGTMPTKAKIVGVHVDRQGPENDGDILVNYDDQWVLIRGEGRLWTDEEMGAAVLRGDLFHERVMATEAAGYRLAEAVRMFLVYANPTAARRKALDDAHHEFFRAMRPPVPHEGDD